jgi:tRNA (mo5U34)-methyltransferase
MTSSCKIRTKQSSEVGTAIYALHSERGAIMEQTAMQQFTWTPERIEQKVRSLGQWFHNLDLRGVQTAPDHFLGDYPRTKWNHFAHAIPPDLHGRTVLDIGCNAGFYSIEMKRRGADRVVGIDSDEKYLAQARFAAEVCGADIEFRNLSVYDVALLREEFDLVLFMGVLYHLRHPLLALDLLREHVVRDTLVFQSMLRGSTDADLVDPDYPFWQTEVFDRASFPRMYFVEHRYAGDPTNWWVPNRACMEAMLRSSGFEIIAQPEDEVYICGRSAIQTDGNAAYPAEGWRE